MAFIVLASAFLFEDVFVIPLSGIQEGVRLQAAHVILAAGDLYVVMRWFAARRLPKMELQIVVFALLVTYDAALGVITQRSPYSLSLYLVFVATLVFYLGVFRKILRARPQLLLSPLHAVTVLYALGLLDWGLSFFYQPLPEILDQRQHQHVAFGDIPRFEGFSALSLEVAFWVAVYFLIAYVRRSRLAMSFAVLLMTLTFSAGAYLACGICIAVYLVAATDRPAVRFLVCIAALGIVALSLLAAISLKTATWSEAERLSYYLYLPDFLRAHPGGIGLGISRSLTDMFQVPMLSGGNVNHTNTESSFLDLAYELGIAGIALYLWLLSITLRMVRYAVKAGGHIFVIVFANLFVLLHAFFVTAYFTQPRYLLLLMSMLTIWADRRRASGIARSPAVNRLASA